MRDIPLIAIPEDAKCQEAQLFSSWAYVACGMPAVAIVYDQKTGRGYYMCNGCAYHNIHNRRGKIVSAINKIEYQNFLTVERRLSK